jgi:hypothetical protein
MKLSKLMVAAGFACLTACGTEMAPEEAVQNGEPANYSAMDYTWSTWTCYTPFWCAGQARWAQFQWSPNWSGSGNCKIGSIYGEAWMTQASATPAEGCFNYWTANFYSTTSFDECTNYKAAWIASRC